MTVIAYKTIFAAEVNKNRPITFPVLNYFRFQLNSFVVARKSEHPDW